MVLLDLLHVQRAGFFKFLKLGIDKELSQLNISVDKTRLQVIPFFGINTSSINAHSEHDVSHFLNLSQQSTTEGKFSPKFIHESFNARRPSKTRSVVPCFERYDLSMLTRIRGGVVKSPIRRDGTKCTSRSHVPVGLGNSHGGLGIQKTALSPEPFTGMLRKSASNGRSSLHILPRQRFEKKAFKKKHGEIGNDQVKQALRDPRETQSVTSQLPSETSFGDATLGSRRSVEATFGDTTLGSRRPKVVVALHRKIQKTSKLFAETKMFEKSFLNQNSCFRLIASKYSPREAILYQKSWSCKLVVKVLLTVDEKKTKNAHRSMPCRNSRGKAGKGGDQDPNQKRLCATRSEEKSMIQSNESRFKQKKQPTVAKVYAILSNRETKKHDAASFETATSGEYTRSATLRVSEGSPINACRRLLPSETLRVPSAHVSVAPRAVVARHPRIQNTVYFRNIETFKKQQERKRKSQKRDYELFLVLGELPLMTKRGHFIIHGSPRVILSQLVRTPGIYFTQKNNELQADCVPEQGPWLCIYKNISGPEELDAPVPSPAKKLLEVVASTPLRDPSAALTQSVASQLPSETRSLEATLGDATLESRRPEVVVSNKQPRIELPSETRSVALAVHKQPKKANQASYFCYTKQFSSMPFSLIYSTFRVFELHSQFTDQTLLLTKLKTLEKIRKFKEVITTLLTFTWKKRIRRRLQRLYTKRCFISTQQFEKTKVLFRLKKKLILGPLSRKSFNEKLNISSCINIGVNETDFNDDFCVATFADSVVSDPRIQTRLFAKEVRWLPSASTLGVSEGSSHESSINRRSESTLEATWMATFGEYTRSATARSARSTRRQRERFIVEGNERHDPSMLTLGSMREAQEIQKKATFNSFAPTIAFGQGEAYYVGMNQRFKHPSGSPTRHSILPAKQPATLRPQVVVDKVDNYEPVSLEQNKIKETMWLSSATLLSQDLALIVRSLDSYKMLFQDDIDDLNNQRIRTSSDQIQQQIRVGLFRFKKMFVKLIASGNGSTSQTITDFLNGALREFFGSNPLSQFLDQTNPLAEITHKRRISKLGLGGVQRESATLKVRTIHFTYFGRICPIETPEGINAGLVNSLTCLSRVNAFGQLVTPLSPLIERQKQEQFFYYSNQEKKAISTTDTALLKFQRLPNQFIYTKNESQFQQLQPNKVKLRVKSDLQTISLATALIPFLAYDDANRALMGSNMQRQAVPLILPERPIIRTGMESLVINESGHSLQSSSGGFISYISAQYVIILCDTLNKRFLF